MSPDIIATFYKETDDSMYIHVQYYIIIVKELFSYIIYVDTSALLTCKCRVDKGNITTRRIIYSRAVYSSHSYL